MKYKVKAGNARLIPLALEKESKRPSSVRDYKFFDTMGDSFIVVLFSATVGS